MGGFNKRRKEKEKKNIAHGGPSVCHPPTCRHCTHLRSSLRLPTLTPRPCAHSYPTCAHVYPNRHSHRRPSRVLLPPSPHCANCPPALALRLPPALAHAPPACARARARTCARPPALAPAPVSRTRTYARARAPTHHAHIYPPRSPLPPPPRRSSSRTVAVVASIVLCAVAVVRVVCRRCRVSTTPPRSSVPFLLLVVRCDRSFNAVVAIADRVCTHVFVAMGHCLYHSFVKS